MPGWVRLLQSLLKLGAGQAAVLQTGMQVLNCCGKQPAAQLLLLVVRLLGP
jgi:hypothetical protein